MLLVLAGLAVLVSAGLGAIVAAARARARIYARAARVLGTMRVDAVGLDRPMGRELTLEGTLHLLPDAGALETRVPAALAGANGVVFADEVITPSLTASIEIQGERVALAPTMQVVAGSREIVRPESTTRAVRSGDRVRVRGVASPPDLGYRGGAARFALATTEDSRAPLPIAAVRPPEVEGLAATRMRGAAIAAAIALVAAFGMRDTLSRALAPSDQACALADRAIEEGRPWEAKAIALDCTDRRRRARAAWLDADFVIASDFLGETGDSVSEVEAHLFARRPKRAASSLRMLAAGTSDAMRRVRSERLASALETHDEHVLLEMLREDANQTDDDRQWLALASGERPGINVQWLADGPWDIGAIRGSPIALEALAARRASASMSVATLRPLAAYAARGALFAAYLGERYEVLRALRPVDLLLHALDAEVQAWRAAGMPPASPPSNAHILGDGHPATIDDDATAILAGFAALEAGDVERASDFLAWRKTTPRAGKSGESLLEADLALRARPTPEGLGRLWSETHLNELFAVAATGDARAFTEQFTLNGKDPHLVVSRAAFAIGVVHPHLDEWVESRWPVPCWTCGAPPLLDAIATRREVARAAGRKELEAHLAAAARRMWEASVDPEVAVPVRLVERTWVTYARTPPGVRH